MPGLKNPSQNNRAAKRDASHLSLPSSLENKQVKQELDYNTFTCQEIEALKLKPNEIEDIEAELLILENAESLQQSLQTAMQLLHNNETPVIPLLKQPPSFFF